MRAAALCLCCSLKVSAYSSLRTVLTLTFFYLCQQILAFLLLHVFFYRSPIGRQLDVVHLLVDLLKSIAISSCSLRPHRPRRAAPCAGASFWQDRVVHLPTCLDLSKLIGRFSRPAHSSVRTTARPPRCAVCRGRGFLLARPARARL